MAKKRKTREQKKLADSRHDFTSVHTHVASPSYELKPSFLTKTEAKTTVINTNLYSYLKKDLLKTATLSLGILLFQAILFLILKSHIFVIPGLRY